MRKWQSVFIVLLVVVAFLAQACAVPASQRVVAYPPADKTARDILNDKAECDQWAKQETDYANPAAEGAKEGLKWGIIGGAAGAAIGAVLGAIVGDPGTGAGIGAVTGAGAGGLSQGLNRANEAQYRYENAYALCMKARGYLTTH